MNNDLIEQVKKNTWLFSEEQIRNKILEMEAYPENYIAIDSGYVTLYLYKDKKILTKEEFTSEVLNYLYLISLDDKDKIDKTVEKHKDLFYVWFDDVKDNDYFHAVQWARGNMLSYLHY